MYQAIGEFLARFVMRVLHILGDTVGIRFVMLSV